MSVVAETRLWTWLRGGPPLPAPGGPEASLADGLVIGYPELRRSGVPDPGERVGALVYVLRGVFVVSAAGVMLIWLMNLVAGPADAAQRAVLWALPFWAAASLGIGWAMGTARFAQVREGSAVHYFAAVWMGGIASVICSVGLGLHAPYVTAFYLVVAYDSFVLRRADSLRCSAIVVGCWAIVVAIASPVDVEWGVVAFQASMFPMAWAVGSIAHRAYDDAAGRALQLSTTDPLTARRNRAGISAALDEALEAGERTGEPVSVLMLDLDSFKCVNDRLGHEAGDELLRWTAVALEGSLRADTTVGRLGGDEFVAVLPATTREEAEAVAQRVTTTLGERVGASVGWATTPGDGIDGATLLRIADGRLYVIKAERRQRR